MSAETTKSVELSSHLNDVLLSCEVVACTSQYKAHLGERVQLGAVKRVLQQEACKLASIHCHRKTHRKLHVW